jgi:uncharacterized protein with von Willebrand factor type A (vWA) domain
MSDLASLAARFSAALRAAGLVVGAERSARFTRAVTLVEPVTTRQLYWCALATLVADPADVAVLDRVFAMVFGGMADPAQWRGADPDLDTMTTPPPPAAPSSKVGAPPAGGAASAAGPTQAGRPQSTAPYRALAAAAERLSTRDFAALDPDELRQLATVMRELTLATPQRRSRRQRPSPHGHRVDLRATLRQARRSGGYPVRLRLRRPQQRPRRLVVLCDISGSMEPYARAMLQLVYCAAGTRAEVFTFATRLTRLTRIFGRAGLARSRPDVALRRAGLTAPDWSSGTRIGAALKEFNDRYGCRGLARGAVVLVISDGWETGDPTLLGAQLARLSKVAYRIVWANPRTASPGYAPLVGGMAAAWPYCDAVVSAHRLDALDELTAAIADAQRNRLTSSA